MGVPPIKHLACIMDGNRRWAKKKGWVPWLGHREGVQAVRRTIDFCLHENILFLSLYAFSIENFKRSHEELQYLFDILAREMYTLRDECIKKEVRVKFIGDQALFPVSLLPMINDVEQKTAHAQKLTVLMLFCYGGRQEIIHAINKIMQNVRSGLIMDTEISDELFERYLWTKSAPVPDLIIRTGGQKRLSNFLLYQAAYSELYFLDSLWPDITKDDLSRALIFYAQCKRNFGA